MEFTWRMVSTLAWPAAVVIIALVFRTWIVDRLDSLGIKLGSLDVQLKTLDGKVDRVGEDVSVTLSENTPSPLPVDEIPQSLVDLMAMVAKNQTEAIRAAFDLVHRALKQHYPQLRRVLPAQLPEAMRRLVDQGEMEADVAWSVQQLYELLTMPEWEKDTSGGTRGYAFLMLAEGAIHGILRTAGARNEQPAGNPPAAAPALLARSWRGVYNDAYPIRLHITPHSDSHFDGTMTYPDGDTVTRISGTIEKARDGIRLSWRELEVTRQGSRTIDMSGYYKATIEDDNTMRGAWYQADRMVARFRLTASQTS